MRAGSLEGHFKGVLNKPSDIFSIVAVVCFSPQFGKWMNGLMAYVGDEEIKCQVLGLLWDDRAADYHSYRPFSTWPNVTDDVFRDLMAGMTNLDPQKRTTAKEVLSHPWFGEV
jgi:serine/threonine protein kinase